MDKNNWIKSPWTICPAIVVFSLFLLMGYDYSEGNPILTKTGEIIIFIWDVLFAFLNLNIKMWWIIAAFGIFIFILYLIIHFKEKDRNRKIKDI